jgi:hypothetical protein
MALICQIVRWSRNGNTEEAATVCARCSPGQVAPFAVQRMGSASSPASGNHATGSIAVAAGSALLDIPGTVRTAATIASTTRLGAELASGGGITTTAPLIAGGTVGTYLYGTHPYGGIDSRPPHGRLRRADPGQVSEQRHQSAGATRHSSLAATSDCRSTLCCSRKIGQLSPSRHRRPVPLRQRWWCHRTGPGLSKPRAGSPRLSATGRSPDLNFTPSSVGSVPSPACGQCRRLP